MTACVGLGFAGGEALARPGLVPWIASTVRDAPERVWITEAFGTTAFGMNENHGVIECDRK